MAANAIVRAGVTLRDNRGHVGRSSWHYEAQISVAANLLNAFNACQGIANAIANCSNAAVVGQSGLIAVELDPLDYGASLQYANAEDKARFVFGMVDDDVTPVQFGFMRIDVPAPKLSIFFADQETVNPSATAAAALIAAILTADATTGVVVTSTGLIPSAFVAGYRLRRKLQRKLTIYDKSPNLDEPEE